MTKQIYNTILNKYIDIIASQTEIGVLSIEAHFEGFKSGIDVELEGILTTELVNELVNDYQFEVIDSLIDDLREIKLSLCNHINL